MKITIIDDEATVRKNFRAMLEKYIPEVEVVGEADGVAAGLSQLEIQPTDILFLDVEMKDGTGFDLLSQYGETDFHVVFATGHDKYAIKAFKYSAIDYLLKPVYPNDLKEVFEKVRKRENAQISSSVRTLVENQGLDQLEKKIILKDKETVYVVQIKEIIRCESDSNYTIFHLIDGRTITMSKTLKEYEKLFDDLPFFRSHQSHLVNLTHIQKLDKRDGGTICMNDGSTAPLASRKKEHFLERLSEI